MSIDIKNAEKVKIVNAKVNGIEIKNVKSVEMKNIDVRALYEQYCEEITGEWWDNDEVMDALNGVHRFLEWIEEKDIGTKLKDERVKKCYGQEPEFYWMAWRVDDGWSLIRWDHPQGVYAPTVEMAIEKMRERDFQSSNQTARK